MADENVTVPPAAPAAPAAPAGDNLATETPAIQMTIQTTILLMR